MNDRTNKKTSLKNPVSIALFSYFSGYGTPLSNSLYSMQPPLAGFLCSGPVTQKFKNFLPKAEAGSFAQRTIFMLRVSTRLIHVRSTGYTTMMIEGKNF